MKKVGIGIDAWKLPIFKKHLEANNFQYEQCPGLAKGTLLLKVETESVAKLKPVVEAAELECKANGNV